MTRIVLHPAFPRTATTWLQSNLQFSDEVNYLGILNPKSAYPMRWQFPVLGQAMDALRGHEANFEPIELHHDVANYIENLPQEKQKNCLVLSDERISKPWRSGDPKWREALVTRAYEYFPEAEILFTTRTQSGITSSLYRGYWYGGGRQTLAEWLEAGGGSTDVSFWQRWDFFSLYEAFNEKFAGRITVLPYEQLKADQSGFCSEMSRLTGLQSFTNPHDKAINQANRSVLGQKKAGLLKQFFSKPAPEQEHPLLDQQTMDYIQGRFTKGNEKLSRACGIDLSPYHY